MNMFIVSYYICALILIFNHATIASEVTTKAENDESEIKKQNLKLINFDDFCGETLEDDQFLLQSPRYPENYPDNLDCQLSLKGRNCPVYYKFRFIDFDIRSSPGCVEDRLEIGLLDALCGIKNGTKTYLAKNGTLTLNFKTNENNSSRGYRILVTKIEECAKKETADDPPAILKTSVMKTVNPNLKQCCSDSSHSSKHFILKSPNFPLSMTYPTDCITQINKASPDICRIRIVFKFFWFGNSLDCKEGFFQIDGKTICGCRTDLKLTSIFEENVKILRFRSEGLVRNSYSGFEAEVFQDECPKKIRALVSDFRNETDLKLPDVSTELNFLQKKFENYIYERPREKNFEEEREPDEFLATEDINGILGSNFNNFDDCLQWNQAQFDEIFYGKEIKIEECRSAQSRNNERRRCTSFMDQRGFILSPGYPFFYPGNLRTCYRFNKLPGSCAVRIHFLDFRIGPSEACSEDRLEINDRNFCGFDLWNKMVTLDLRYKYSVDLNFITSTPKCVQGFKAYYEFLPCNGTPTESPIPPPITKIYPVPPPITEVPRRNCGGVIREEVFTLTNGEGSYECDFIIEKYARDVCQLILKFDRFSLDCSSEMLQINGKPFCGNLVGNEVVVNMRDFPAKIIYRNFRFRNIGIFRITGVQDSTNCPIPEPPAQLS